MISAAPTPDENQRLNALYGYDILDSVKEQDFDELTQLASEICETPIALISLIDPKRQWFKSCVGLDVQETSRELAFCAHAIHEREIFEIPNALEDERFFDNPLVTGDPNIRFYAGAQLVTPEGYAIGTLCAIGDHPKTLNSYQKAALKTLAKAVITQLELRKKLKETQQASDYKTEFLSNISHEIRTPLNAISGFSQILVDKAKNLAIPPQATEYLSEIEFSAQRLLHIVNSVLELGKIEAGKMDVTYNWFASRHFFNHLKGMLSVKANEKSLNLQFLINPNVPEYLYFDEGKFGQILINIINNAVKFTPPNKTITVSITAENKQLLITVIDQGIGIAKSEQAKLFDKYQQVAKHEYAEGSGLGLSITKSLVELMAGAIALESELDQGTKVSITLPLTETTPPNNISQSLDSSQLQSQLPRYHLLIVEDNAINRKVAQAVFGSLNQSISFAESGEAAVELCKSEQYDAIFMDIHLSGIDGITAARAIRALGVPTPIFALTADIFLNAETCRERFEFDDYLAKPLEKEKLTLCLRQLAG
ncbi:ATP-binding protein [Colwellia sp. MEBiC06753]